MVIKVGDTLPNQSIVIAFRPTRYEGERLFGVVLALNAESHAHPYITWEVKSEPGKIDTYWGHYYDNPQDAVDDYTKRKGCV